MTIGYIRNQRPSSYGAAMSLLPEMLAAAGWTYQASGAGTGQSYSSNGKVFTNIGSGPTGWSNVNAWARMQDPGGGRELVFQHDNAGAVRIKYSASAKFTGGSPANDVLPTATDQVFLWGALGSAGNWFSTEIVNASIGGGGGNVVFLGAAKDTAPYGFWFAANVTGSANETRASALSTLMMDPVSSVAEDPDPVVFHVSDSSGFFTALNLDGGPGGGTAIYDKPSGQTNSGTWGYMDAAKTRFLLVLPSMYVSGINGQTEGTGITIPWPATGTASGGGWLGPNSFSGKQDLLPLFYMRMQNFTTERPGVKGWSTLCRFSSLPSCFRETTGSRSWINLGALWLPWDGATVPLQ